jgi:hypothetical protein
MWDSFVGLSPVTLFQEHHDEPVLSRFITFIVVAVHSVMFLENLGNLGKCGCLREPLSRRKPMLRDLTPNSINANQTSL